jgi:hypothetical protein
VKLRDTFTLTEDGGHLWVVCSFPTETDGSVAIINMTTWRTGCDESCVIEAGEHPWVKHKTVMKFDAAQLPTPSQQTAMRGSGFRAHTPVASDLLDRIQRAAILSIYTARKIQDVIKWSRAKQAKPA